MYTLNLESRPLPARHDAASSTSRDLGGDLRGGVEADSCAGWSTKWELTGLGGESPGRDGSAGAIRIGSARMKTMPAVRQLWVEAGGTGVREAEASSALAGGRLGAPAVGGAWVDR